MKLSRVAAAEAQASPPITNVRFGRSGQPCRNMTIRRAESGTEMPRMKARQVSASPSDAGWVSGTRHERPGGLPVGQAKLEGRNGREHGGNQGADGGEPHIWC